MIFSLLFGFQPEEIISRNISYCASSAPLGFDSPGTSVGEITSLKQLDFTWRSSRHLGFRLHGKGNFRSRMNYHHNSTASFQLIWLVKSGDASTNPCLPAIPVVIGNWRPTNCWKKSTIGALKISYFTSFSSSITKAYFAWLKRIPMGRFHSIVAFNSSFLLATFRTFRTFGLLFYVVLLCPTSALSELIYYLYQYAMPLFFFFFLSFFSFILVVQCSGIFFV